MKEIVFKAYINKKEIKKPFSGLPFIQLWRFQTINKSDVPVLVTIIPIKKNDLAG